MQIFCISIVDRKNVKVNKRKKKKSGESRAFLLFRKSRENRIGIPEAVEGKGKHFICFPYLCGRISSRDHPFGW